MRLAYLSGSTVPSQSANSVHVMKQCAALARAGAEVTLHAMQGDQAQINPFAHYGVDENFILKRSAKISVIQAPIRILSMARHLWCSANIDISYGRDVIALALMSLQMPVAIEFHHLPQGIAKIAFKNIVKSKHLHAAIVISNTLKSDLCNQYPELDINKVHVLHDGADVILPSAPPAALRGTFKVGYAGSLLSGKGADLIPYMARLCPEIDFHICGGQEGQINNLKSIYNGDNIHYHGYIPAHKVPDYIRAFDVALAPYQKQMPIRNGIDIARWISPLKLFEYMAAQTPIVASSLPILQEVLHHEKNAYLVTQMDDPQSWVNAIKELKADKELRQKLSQDAFHDLQSQYSWDKRAQKILQILS